MGKMWDTIRKFMPQHRSLSALDGSTVFACRPREGLVEYAAMQVSLKRTGAGANRRLYVDVKLVAEGWTRVLQPVGYINFDMVTVRRLHDDLEQCIKVMEAQER
ncbi:hypothetical protein [Methylocystis suflitae]|uniref:hypothetical protein n=1 Tax=Methylocystis suflitae TaxID=2951405 RepID=UPI002108B20E|nr:hypothetical protein [Methylocystis suflitae]MCQ4189186.1 hypothetical protein [Methylocystis suflitae]